MGANFILKGDICYSQSKDIFITKENHYLVCENDKVAGVYKEIPAQYAQFPVSDYSGQLIVPGLVDLHVHAPQYSFRGIGMDMELLDWLNTRTFPEESKYKSMDYAKKAYDIFTESLRKSATTRAAVFATLHVPATIYLMESLYESGVCGYVGKVNMDRNSPDILCEADAGQSIKDTEDWLEACGKLKSRIKPILTPRFIPTCSDELMEGLKKVQLCSALPLQSHLSENQGEIAWVKELCPEAAFYGDAYDRFGMFGNEVPTIMAHCVYSDDAEIERMKKNGVYIAHCPQSNSNLSSGIAPIRSFLEQGLKVGLGSDVAGGASLSIFRAMADAVQVSKLRWRLLDESQKPVTVREAFYMGTKGGGEFFGKVGSFETDYEFDALVLDESHLKHPLPLTMEERVERFLYLADDRDVQHKFVKGSKLF